MDLETRKFLLRKEHMDARACRLSSLELRKRGGDRGLRNGKGNSRGGNTHICCSLTSVGALSKERNKEKISSY